MSILRRLPLLAAAAAVFLVGFWFLAGHRLLLRHISRATGRQEVEVIGCWNCHLPRSRTELRRGRPHPEPRALAPLPNGLLAVACGPTREIVLVDPAAGRAQPPVPVPGDPAGLAVAPDGGLWATLAGPGLVVELDPATLTERRRLQVGLRPAGLAFAAGGERLFVANAGDGTVSVLDPAAGRELARVEAGREPFAVAASPDGARVAVVSRMASVGRPDRIPTSELTLLDGRSGRVEARIPLPSCHLSEGLAFTPDGSRLLVPAVRVRNLLPIVQVARGWVMSSVLAVVPLADPTPRLLPLGGPETPFPDPGGIAVDAAGRRVFIAGGGGDEIEVLDLEALLAAADALDPAAPEDFSLNRHFLRRRFACGDNPRGLALLAGAEPLLAVAERLDDTVALFRPDGSLAERIPVGRPVREDPVHRGDRVFHDAGYAFQGAFSCRSCHPGGHTDGLVYDFDIDGIGRNMVLNRSLRGVAGTAPFKWNGKNPTLQRQCGPRFAMVLTRADPFPEDRLEDLVAFIQSLPPPPPLAGAGRVAGIDTGAVARGEAIFFRDRRRDGSPIPPSGRCVTCHPPPHYSRFQKADVGTRSPWDGSGEFDIPHLTGIGSKAPYLHDGRARTLEEIWTAEGVGDSHGAVTDLGKTGLNDLVQFLRTR
ncbi:MAG: hypothetical protein D6702_06390 [Planctomycetota bacterium]|nr:MAG: hypothetical protein D6702_06390 [Planctomycetota bacterium]